MSTYKHRIKQKGLKWLNANAHGTKGIKAKIKQATSFWMRCLKRNDPRSAFADVLGYS